MTSITLKGNPVTPLAFAATQRGGNAFTSCGAKNVVDRAMKRLTRNRHLAIACLSATCALVLPARAATYQWDGQADNNRWDSTADHNGTTFYNWSPEGIPGSGDVVTFDVITSLRVSPELGADRTVNSVQFGNLGANHTLASGGGGSTPWALTLSSGSITVASGLSSHEISAGVTLGNTGNWNIGDLAVFEVSGIVSGGFGLDKSGAGTLKLTGTGTNSYTGSTAIKAGTLIATGADERLPDGTAVRIDSGAALRIDGITESFDGLKNFAGSLFLDNDATLQVAPSAPRFFPGTITGASGTTLAVTGGAQQRLDAANPDFFGTARVTGGKLSLNHADALQNATVDIQVDDGLDVTTAAIDANIGALSGTGDLSLGSQILVTGLNNASSSYSGTLSGDTNSFLQHNGSGTLTLTGGSVATPSTLGHLLSKNADGAIVLDGARMDLSSPEDSTSIIKLAFVASEGDITLQGGADVQLVPDGFAWAKNATVTVNGAGTSLSAKIFGLSTKTNTTGSLVVENSGEVTVDLTLGVGLEGDGDLTLSSGGTVTVAAGGKVYIGDKASGDALVTGTGSQLTADTLLLGGQTTSSYLGTGTLTVENGGAIEISGTTWVLNTNSSITIDGGTLETGKLNGSPSGGTGTISLSDPVGGSALTVGTNNGDSTFDGVIQDASGGPGGLKKVGTGAFTLTGANTYTGGTIVDGGTLLANNGSGSATGPGTLQVNNGAVLGGSGTVDDTTILSGATIAPGDNVIDTLNVRGSLSISGTYRCELANSSADRLDVTTFLFFGAGSVIDFDETAPPAGAALIVAKYGSLIGTFDSVTNLPADYKLVYDYDDGSSSNNIALVPLTTYETWADANGLTLGDNDGFNDDPNNDGRLNIEHFAFDTDPLGDGSDEGKTRNSIENITSEDYLTLTLPVRVGAVFSGDPLSSAAVDGITYAILGDDDLQDPWDLTVEEVTPALDAGLPALDDYDGVTGADWEYRSFRLSDPVSTRPHAFLKTEVSEAP